MFNMNDIYARLQAGEKIDDIGNEIAGMMNQAVAKFEADKAAEAAKVAETEAAKRDLMEEMVEIVQEFAILEGMDPEELDVDDEDIDNLVHAFTEMFSAMREIKKMVAASAPKKATFIEPAATIKAKPMTASDEQILADFLKQFN
jgi:hypothetical protein